MGFVTHCEIAISTNQQLACGDGVDRAGSAGQSHCLENIRAAAHHRDARDLQPKATSFLRQSQQSCLFDPAALRVLHHLALGAPEDADLESLLHRDQAAIVAAATHDCRRGGCRHWGRERRGACAVIVLRLAGGDVVAVDGRVGVAGVGVQIARDLGVGRCCQ